ncbi:hypothetical protein ACWCPI_38745 [Streptomyces sp. NPDC001920]
MSPFSLATDQVTSGAQVLADTEASVLLADIVNTRRLPTRTRGG